MTLAGNVAIIIGGGGSIGRSIALQLARDGARIAVIDIDPQRAQDVADEVTAAGSEAMALALDVRDRPAVRHMVAAVLERFGHIDIFVSSAGGSARDRMRRFHELEEDTLDWVLGVNLLGVLNCIRAVVNPMIERRRGRIVNIASIVAMQGKARCVDYATAKGGVIAMTKSLAIELGEFGITVNCVSPGLVPRDPDAAGHVVRTNVLGRLCSPDDVAHLVRFLASADADFITGQNYVIDGGRSLGLRGDS